MGAKVLSTEKNQQPQRTGKNPYAPPNETGLLDGGHKKNGHLICFQQAVFHFGFLSILFFGISMVVPAIKYGKAIYGYECVFWGGVLIFCAPPAGGAGRVTSFLSFIGTIGNVAIFVSWLHFLGFVQLRRRLQLFASSILFIRVTLLTFNAFNRRVFDAVYFGYWSWVGSLCLSAFLLAAKAKTKKKPRQKN